jgi:hypothetical protein
VNGSTQANSSDCYSVVGVCSLCGGPVKMFAGAWGGSTPPEMFCGQCNAVADTEYSPKVIRMRPRYSQQAGLACQGLLGLQSTLAAQTFVGF